MRPNGKPAQKQAWTLTEFSIGGGAATLRFKSSTETGGPIGSFVTLVHLPPLVVKALGLKID